MTGRGKLTFPELDKLVQFLDLRVVQGVFRPTVVETIRVYSDGEIIALHEAGHATAAFFIGQRGCDLTIDPNGKKANWFEVDWEFSEAIRWQDCAGCRDNIEKKMLVFLGGPVAEYLVFGRHASPGTREDLDRLRESIGDLFDDTDDAEAYFGWLLCRSRTLVREWGHFECLLALAAALGERKALTEEQANRLLSDTHRRFLREIKKGASRTSKQQRARQGD